MQLVGEVRIPRGGGVPIALTDRSALLRPIAPDGPSAIFEVAELASGQIAPMPFDELPFWGVTLVAASDGPLVAAQTSGLSAPPEVTDQRPVQPEVTLIRLADMKVMAVHEPDASALRILDQDEPSVGVDLPSGWLLVTASQPGEPWMFLCAMNTDDGSLVWLPGAGAFTVEG